MQGISEANVFYQESFNPWLNLHRPCMFATDKTNKGKIVKVYKPATDATPSAATATMRHTEMLKILFITRSLLMRRKNFNQAGIGALGALILASYQQAHAISLGDLSGITNQEAGSGLKTALEKGALAAVALLGKTDGFLGNPIVRIPLPGYLEEASKLLKSLGQGRRIDELVTSINRAAEAAVPMGKDLLVSAVRGMNVNDAKKILAGGETSVTTFFAEKTRAPLGLKFLPIVTKATEKVGLANKYNEFAGKAAKFGLVKKEDANIQQYVTGKSLDGLYLIIGEEEKKIRQDPVGTGSAILKKVFGSMK